MKKLSKSDLQLNPTSITKQYGVGPVGENFDVPKTSEAIGKESCFQCIATIGADCNTFISECDCMTLACTHDCVSDGCENPTTGGGENQTLSCVCGDTDTDGCPVNTYGCRTKECNTVDPCNLSDAYCDESRGEYVCESIDKCIDTSDNDCFELTGDDCELMTQNENNSCNIYGCYEETVDTCAVVSANINCLPSVGCNE